VVFVFPLGSHQFCVTPIPPFSKVAVVCTKIHHPLRKKGFLLDVSVLFFIPPPPKYYCSDVNGAFSDLICPRYSLPVSPPSFRLGPVPSTAFLVFFFLFFANLFFFPLMFPKLLLNLLGPKCLHLPPPFFWPLWFVGNHNQHLTSSFLREHPFCSISCLLDLSLFTKPI